MSSLLDLDFGDRFLALLLGVFLQVSAVSLLAWLVILVAGRPRAALRHFISRVALSCVLVSPVLLLAAEQIGFVIDLGPGLISVNRAGPDEAGAGTASLSQVRSRIQGQVSPLPSAGNADGQGRRAASHRPRPLHRSLAEGAREKALSTSSVVPSPKAPASTQSRFRMIAGVVILVWMAGIVVGLLRLICGVVAVVVLRQGARRVGDPKLEEMARRVGESIGLCDGIQVLTHDRISIPVALGFFRPAILLPERLLGILEKDQLRQVLLHEAAHVHRKDAIAGLIQRLCRILYWPHPLVHAIDGALSRAREEICDNYVLLHGNSLTYSRTLLELSTADSRRPAGLPGLCHLTFHWKLSDRVAGLLDENRNVVTRMRPKDALITCAFVVTLLFFLTSVSAFPLAPKKEEFEFLTESKNQTEFSKEMKDALKGLEKSVKTLLKIGDEEGAKRLLSVAATLEQRLERALALEAVARLEKSVETIETLHMARDALCEAGREDDGDLLDLAAQSIRVQAEKRNDREARAIKKSAPKRSEQADLLRLAAEILRSNGDTNKADLVSGLGSALLANTNGKKRKGQRGPRKSRGRRSRKSLRERTPRRTSESSTG